MTDTGERASPQKIAEQIADDLFVNGAGERAQRLVLTVDSPKKLDLGGWSYLCLVDRIADILKESLQ